MSWRNTGDGYGLVQILLHWTMAGLIAFLLTLGLWMTGLDYYDPWYNRAPDLHRAIGMLFGILLLLRVLVRLKETQPRRLTGTGWETRAAVTAHRLLYLLPLLVVASGYLISTADGRAVDVFGWFQVPAIVHGVEGQADIAGDIHFVLSMLLLVVIALHTAGALHHHFVLKDATLRRMLKP